MGARMWRRLVELVPWLAVFLLGVFVGTWWAYEGSTILIRLAAWSERPAAPGSIRPTAEQIKATQEVWRKRKAE